jgi:hypothetical protein
MKKEECVVSFWADVCITDEFLNVAAAFVLNTYYYYYYY